MSSSRRQLVRTGFASKVQGDVTNEVALLTEDGDLGASGKGAPSSDFVGESDTQELTNKKFPDVNALSLVATNTDQELTHDLPDSIVQKMLGRAFQYFMAGG